MTTQPNSAPAEPTPRPADPTLARLTDDLETLRTRPFDGTFYDDAARLARRIRAVLAAQTAPAVEDFRTVIDDAPRLAARMRTIDERRARIARDVELVLATTEGTVRSAEVTRLALRRLGFELAALAHLSHDVVVESLSTDIGGPG